MLQKGRSIINKSELRVDKFASLFKIVIPHGLETFDKIHSCLISGETFTEEAKRKIFFAIHSIETCVVALYMSLNHSFFHIYIVYNSTKPELFMMAFNVPEATSCEW